jgi:hypothetical protein
MLIWYILLYYVKDRSATLNRNPLPPLSLGLSPEIKLKCDEELPGDNTTRACKVDLPKTSTNFGMFSQILSNHSDKSTRRDSESNNVFNNKNDLSKIILLQSRVKSFLIKLKLKSRRNIEKSENIENIINSVNIETPYESNNVENGAPILQKNRSRKSLNKYGNKIKLFHKYINLLS